MDRRRVRAYIPLFIAAMLFFMVFEQAASTLTSYFGGLAIVTIAFALALYFLAPWIRRHADARD